MIAQIGTDFFEADHWRDKSKITGEARGRAAVFFISDGPLHFVLRHYRRGGFAAKFLRDQYFWCGLERSRAFREWHLLDWMFQHKLPVPRPLAARVIKTGFSYTADLATETLPKTQSLAALLENASIEQGCFRQVGQCIRRFHDHQIYHADLNAHNILRNDAGDIFLIDFDQGQKISGGGVWKQNTLFRLKRSLLKIQKAWGKESAVAKQWKTLLEGYG